MRRFAFLFLLFFCATGWAQNGGGLTLNQIERLVKIPSPDGVIATQIQNRGLAFKVTPALLERLTSDGAGPQTLTQLRARIEVATIALGAGTSAAIVTVDGKERSRYGPGFPSSIEVATGKHHITVSLENYRSLDLDVNLANKETYTLKPELTWAGGFINVDVSPLSAFIRIHPEDAKNSLFESKPGQRTNALGSELLAGDYTVTTTLPGYLPVTQKVTVHNGERLALHPVLVKDDTYFKRQIEMMRGRLDERSAAAILTGANRLAEDDPKDPDLVDLRIRAAFLSGNTQQFQAIALQAIRAGMSVPVPLQHIHLGFRDTKHPARLTLTAKDVSFDPQGNACTQKTFTENWSNLQSMQFGKTGAGMPILSLHIKSSEKNGKTVTLSFTSGDLPFNSSGPENDASANRLQAVQELLRLQKERAEGTH